MLLGVYGRNTHLLGNPVSCTACVHHQRYILRNVSASTITTFHQLLSCTSSQGLQQAQLNFDHKYYQQGLLTLQHVAQLQHPHGTVPCDTLLVLTPFLVQLF